MQPNLARHIGPRFAYDEQALQVAARDLQRMFPTFAEVPIDAGWGGPIDVAGSHLPFFGTLEHGTVHYGMGLHGQRRGPRSTWAVASWRTVPSVDTTTCSTCRSSMRVRMRFPPEPIRLPRRAHRETTRSVARMSSRTAAKIRTRWWYFVAKLPRRLGYNLVALAAGPRAPRAVLVVRWAGAAPPR
jgi:hypothetical protein